MNCRYLVAVALALATATPLSSQTVKAGIEAWQKSNYAAAVEIWRPLAQQGDADAQFNLGQAYRLGRGVPTNLAAAKSWFERAADQGHVDAETTLGLLLFQNGDLADGLKWLKKAADAGEPRALLVYGTALVNGDSVTQNPSLGYAYVSRAASQGLRPARDTLEQLDKLLPVAARKRGLALARDLAKAASTSSQPAKASKPIETASAKAAPSPTSQAKIASTRSSTGQLAAAAKRERKSPASGSETSAAPAGAKLAASGSWRIQLGAFSQAGNARALYEKLSSNPALAGRQPLYVAAGAITRLQLGPFESRASADATCRKLAVPCFAVPPK